MALRGRTAGNIYKVIKADTLVHTHGGETKTRGFEALRWAGARVTCTGKRKEIETEAF